MTWNNHGIWTKLPSICDMNLLEISKWIHVTFFTQAEKNGKRHIGHSLRSWPMLFSCHLYYLQETSNFLSFRAITFSVFTIFKIRFQINIQHEIDIKTCIIRLLTEKFKIFKFSRHKIFKCQNFQNLTSFSESAWHFDLISCITRHDWKNFKKVRFYPLRGPKSARDHRLPVALNAVFD